MSSMLPYQLISTDQQLRNVLAHWRNCGVLAMDTEIAHAHQVANRKQCVSLVQIWDGEADKIWVVDAFGVDLRPFVDQVIAARPIIKIFHDAPHDLRMLKSLHRAHSIVDTLLLARERQCPRCNLKALALELLGVELDKRFQMSNWALRPLSAEQLQYAALDAWVTYRVWQALMLLPIPEPDDLAATLGG